MPDEAIQITKDVVSATTRLVETGIKKFWSLLDAASEKQTPSEALSPQAIQRIQGNNNG